MPLTPEDVSNKRFTTVRLREGYDMTEVDQFLDEVEAALATMTRENDELRSKLQVAQGGEPVPAAVAPVPEPTPEPEPEPEESPAEPEAAEVPEEVPAEEPVEEPAPEPVKGWMPEPEEEPEPVVAAPAATPAASYETLQVTTTAEASSAATRLLELAGRNADELVLGAREEAEQIVSEARSQAEALESEARQRAEALDHETQDRRASIFGAIEQEKAALDTEIANLRTFEREYRTQLKSYFEQQLEALDGHGEGGSLAEPMGLRDPEPDAVETSEQGEQGEQGDPEVSRLQALLAEDEPHDEHPQG